MPEYLAPGVYVEETSFRAKSIEGVSTTTAGFIGPARYGPLNLEPELLTSLGEFERIYGDGQQLQFSDVTDPVHNYLWHATRAFFEEGGKRLYVVRVFLANSDKDDGCAYTTLSAAGAADDHVITVRARFPGYLGNMRLRFTLSLGQNLLGSEEQVDPATGKKMQVVTARALQDNDVVFVTDIGSPIGSPIEAGATVPGTGGQFYRASREFDSATGVGKWVFYDSAGHEAFDLQRLEPGGIDQARAVTLAVTVFPNDPFALPVTWANLPLDPNHTQVGSGARDDLAMVFAQHPANRADEYRVPIVMTVGAKLLRGTDLLAALLGASKTDLNPAGIETALKDPASLDAQRSFDVLLQHGNDGKRPTATEYDGTDDPNQSFKTGLKSFEDIDDISIVAAPGSTYGLERDYGSNARTIVNLLIGHAERMRYRIAVLDSGDAQMMSQVRAMRGKLDSKYAALYYPWVRVLDPITRREIYSPPSGFVAGIYARNDIQRAVYKAPANEVVTLALGFEILLNKGQQDVLNPEGINCFRYFEGRGFRLWGARTISSDPEWKYVNLRRYFAYLEHSIDKGTQWAVFEPNGDALWANVRRTIEDFLFNEWQGGALLGDKPEKAFFVRCDRSTMTQNDLDNGRLVCLIGVAPLRPAEYVIFRIGQWTADAKR